MKYLLTIFFQLVIVISLIGQSQKTFEKKYLYAKTLLSENKFPQASEVLKGLLVESESNIYIEYATYFYAYSIYNEGKKEECEKVLQQFVKKYPEWNAIDEAWYLLAVTEFELDKPDEALVYIHNISDSTFSENIHNLKATKFSEFTYDQLKFLYASNPTDVELGKVLLLRLYQMKPEDRDEKQFNELIDKYLPDSLKINSDAGEMKEEYNVAVLLPFNEEEIDTLVSKRRNILDLYEGLCLAKEELEKQGKKINLFSFDTKKDSAVTAGIFKQPSLAQMDLIIGPLYSQAVEMANSFSQENKIPLVNPLSRNNSIIENNPNAFLMNPSYKTQGRMLADFAIDSLGIDSTYIVYGGNVKDSLVARSYMNRIMERGKFVNLVHGFDYTEAEFDLLLEELDTLIADSTSSILISTTQQVVAVNVISALQYNKLEMPILGFGEWLNFNQLTFDQMEETNIHFLHPNYVDSEKEIYKQWEKSYFQKMSILPSVYNHIGYETLHFWGSKLHQYGTDVSKKIQSDGMVNGLIFPGFDFKSSNDNQYAPIMKFYDGRLETALKPVVVIEEEDGEEEDSENKEGENDNEEKDGDGNNDDKN